jgi:hypothetical protein
MAPKSRSTIPINQRSPVPDFDAGSRTLRELGLPMAFASAVSDNLKRFCRDAQVVPWDEAYDAEFTTDYLDRIAPHPFDGHNTECLKEAIWVLVVNHLEKQGPIPRRQNDDGVTFRLSDYRVLDSDGVLVYEDVLRHDPSWFGGVGWKSRNALQPTGVRSDQPDTVLAARCNFTPNSIDKNGYHFPFGILDELFWIYSYVIRLQPPRRSSEIVATTRVHVLDRIQKLSKASGGSRLTEEHVILAFNLFGRADFDRDIQPQDYGLFIKSLDLVLEHIENVDDDLSERRREELDEKFSAVHPFLLDEYHRKSRAGLWSRRARRSLAEGSAETGESSKGRRKA